jgi:thiol-disulfide isomerase/thioredoxin
MKAAGQLEPNPLLGKEAPEFSLELLDGSKANLSENKGKIVILDFWATWCGPCRRGLPIVASVAEKYKDKGVVFYAVNQGEATEDIKKFLKDSKLTCPVALDTEDEVGELYGVRGIPHTVIIDKEGTVQVVHVGFSPDLKESLERDIESLLAGKKLAVPKDEGGKKEE